VPSTEYYANMAWLEVFLTVLPSVMVFETQLMVK
jgi:hypothetical protein